MYSKRYKKPCNRCVPQPPPQMPFVLETLKHEDPDQFHKILCVSPSTFDQLVDKIKDDPVFFNNSNNPQIPVEEQVAITLFKFRHNGNAASQESVARWEGEGSGGKGSPALHTKYTMTAILWWSFISKAVQLPTPQEKEAAKAWIEAYSC